MKYIFNLMLLLFIIGNISAVDTESYEFIDHLLSINSPGTPEVFEDAVIFTAPSEYKRVGIAFAHEGFSRVYWFRKLMVPKEEAPAKVNPDPKKALPPKIVFADSGILFYTFTIPLNMSEISYRLVIDGLWTTDPANPNKKIDLNSGLEYSVITLPVIQRNYQIQQDESGSITFRFSGPSGETVTLAGSFNGWDPFMYQMRETSPGVYNLTLSLPPGQYHYVFYHRGQRMLDPVNPQRIYTREGLAASEIRVN